MYIIDAYFKVYALKLGDEMNVAKGYRVRTKSF